MIRSDSESILSDARVPLDGVESNPGAVERLIRWALSVGFLTVLGLEAWFLIRAWESVF